ncbi:MAG: hypothetical protein B9S32_10310 [Verrucomicrobia bacterium Tous-C9LFEB]|nr:MAG: hypothetical protein B9S32_10310 [Verrucomicrobia bacterium Tous-C9LFEB]
MKRPPEYPCTQADVAKLAGVSVGTVSMALKKDARILPTTQARVQRAARQLGYRPDPMLSALVARRFFHSSRKALSNLALIVDDRWYKANDTQWIDVILDGMRKACSQHGYSLEILQWHRDLLQSKQPDKLLRSRGIRGLAILSTTDGKLPLKLDWNKYAVVALGRQPANHLFHRVGPDFFASMDLACMKLAEMGYRRVGLVNDMATETRYRYEWIGSIVKESYIRPPRVEVVPPHLPDDFDKDEFFRWVKHYQPDCVIANYPTLRRIFEEGGWKVPRDIGLALLTQYQLDDSFTSVIHDSERIGMACIDLLHNLLMRGETGQPETLTETLIYPTWREAKTTRRLIGKPAKARAK